MIEEEKIEKKTNERVRRTREWKKEEESREVSKEKGKMR